MIILSKKISAIDFLFKFKGILLTVVLFRVCEKEPPPLSQYSHLLWNHQTPPLLSEKDVNEEENVDKPSCAFVGFREATSNPNILLQERINSSF